MSGQKRADQARTIKACLDDLYASAVAADMRMLAHLIGVASEAASDIVDRPPTPLRLVKTAPR